MSCNWVYGHPARNYTSQPLWQPLWPCDFSLLNGECKAGMCAFLGLGVKTVGHTSSTLFLLPSSWDIDMPVTYLWLCRWALRCREAGATRWKEPGSLNFCKAHDCFASLECSLCYISNKKSCISFDSLYFGVSLFQWHRLYHKWYKHSLYVAVFWVFYTNYLINEPLRKVMLLCPISRWRNRLGGLSEKSSEVWNNDQLQVYKRQSSNAQLLYYCAS